MTIILKTQEELYTAYRITNRLLAKKSLKPHEENILNAISVLIAEYEGSTEPKHASEMTPAEILEFLMDVETIDVPRLFIETGLSKGVIISILNGECMFSQLAIERLSRFFKISQTVLNNCNDNYKMNP